MGLVSSSWSRMSASRDGLVSGRLEDGLESRVDADVLLYSTISKYKFIEIN